MSTQDAATRRIVVGLDGSPSSIAALRWAARQAELTGAELDVIMTWEWPMSYGWSVIPSNYDPTSDCEKVLADAVSVVRSERPGLVCRSTVLEGHPAPLLVKASKEAELLVVGSRGHGQFAGMLLGSVSEHCAANAHCPVLILRDEE